MQFIFLLLLTISTSAFASEGPGVGNGQGDGLRNLQIKNNTSMCELNTLQNINWLQEAFLLKTASNLVVDKALIIKSIGCEGFSNAEEDKVKALKNIYEMITYVEKPSWCSFVKMNFEYQNFLSDDELTKYVIFDKTCD